MALVGYLFFRFFVPIFRGELTTAALHMVLSVFPFGLWQLIVPFLYNKQFMTRMLEKGYMLADTESAMLLARSKLGIAAPNITGA